VHDDSGNRLPTFGNPVGEGGPPQLTGLELPADDGSSVNGVVRIAAFAGELGMWKRPSGALRFFVPSRSENDFVQVIDAVAPSADAAPELSCFTTLTGSRDCSSAAFSMSAFADPGSNLPRASSPYGVSISDKGEVFVTHLTNADSPRGSNKNLTSYVVKMDAEAPALDETNFIPIGAGAVNTSQVGKRWVYLTGRALSGGTQLVRMLRRDIGALIGGGIEIELGVIEARGMSLSSDETRLYLAGRSPDRLAVVSITGADTDAPALRLERLVPLPSGPNSLVTIPRAGRADLVAITCSNAGVVVLYDDDVGALVSQVQGVGSQPYALAPDLQGSGVRFYVSNFADGRVAVIDVPDLDAPQTARVVAHLGAQQGCITHQEREPCK
jgi:hypothetical protein